MTFEQHGELLFCNAGSTEVTEDTHHEWEYQQDFLYMYFDFT